MFTPVPVFYSCPALWVNTVCITDVRRCPAVGRGMHTVGDLSSHKFILLHFSLVAGWCLLSIAGCLCGFVLFCVLCVWVGVYGLEIHHVSLSCPVASFLELTWITDIWRGAGGLFWTPGVRVRVCSASYCFWSALISNHLLISIYIFMGFWSSAILPQVLLVRAPDWHMSIVYKHI